MTTLVFLEHHGGELRRARSACSRRRRRSAATSPASSSARASTDSAAQAGTYGAATVYVADDPALEAPLPQPRVDVLAQLVAREGRRERALRRVGARRRRRRRPRRAARRRAQLGSDRPLESTAASSSASAGARRLGRRRRRLDVDAADRALPLRRVRPVETGGRPTVETFDVHARGLLARGRDGRAGARGGERPVDRGRGRDRRRRSRPRRPEDFALVEELAEALGGAVARDPRGRRRRLVPVRDAGRADGQDGLAEALRRARHLRRDPAQGRHAELGDDRRDQQGPERADLRVRRPRRRRRPAPDRSRS